MNMFRLLFVRAPRKILRILLYKVEYLYYRFFRFKLTLNGSFAQGRYLLCGGGSLDDIAKNYRDLFPEKVRGKIAEADLICDHVFKLLGSEPKKLSQDGDGYRPIDWHSDLRSGFRWGCNTFFRDIRYGHMEGVDIKAPWELSRFQHLNALGQAYVLTKSRKYADEFSSQITDWIKNNPVAFGVNWKCTMDVAIRAVNWLVGMEYFAEEGVFSHEFLKEFYISIYEHGRFIRRHLEYSAKLTTNHYIADIAGLLFISVYCPFFKESKEKWQEFAIRELSKEMEKQVYRDGCDFEASTSYHRLLLEMFFYCELLCKRAGIEIAAKYQATLRKMFEFSLYCTKPNGMIPQVGDNDSGRFLTFVERPILEHKYLLTLASIHYTDSSFKLPEFDFDEEAFWVCGDKSKKVYDRLPLRTAPLGSKSFPDAGWFIIRHNNDSCFISSGPNGLNGRGGHAHNDKLSFELMSDGQDIIVDPGTYVYTPYPEERNKFRSTEYHNTVKFNGYEQNEIPKKGIFSLPDKVEIKNASLTEAPDQAKFEGEVQYLDFTHSRTIILDKKSHSWRIVDNISCLRPVKARLMFHLSPNLTSDGNNILIRETNAKVASIEVEGGSFEKRKYDYSPEYGVKARAECLVANVSVDEGIQTINTYINRS